MGEESTGFWLVGITTVGMLFLYLLTGGVGPSGAPVAEAVVSQPVQVVSVQVPVEPLPSPTPFLPSEVTLPSPVVSKPLASQPPYVNAGGDLTLDERESVRLDGEGYDPAGGGITIHWTAECGRGAFDNPNQLCPLYTAPSTCACEECIALTLTVTNKAGVSTSDQLFVRLRGDALVCPVSAPCEPCGETPCPGKVCEEKRDPCRTEPLPCEVPCIPHVEPVEACATAPVPCCDPCAVFGESNWLCGEESECGWSGPLPWVKSVSTECPPKGTPAPFIHRDYRSPVYVSETVQLVGEVVNPGCLPVCFSWSANKGWFEDLKSLTPLWHAPTSVYAGADEACITLTVNDACGGRAYDQIRFQIVDRR